MLTAISRTHAWLAIAAVALVALAGLVAIAALELSMQTTAGAARELAEGTGFARRLRAHAEAHVKASRKTMLGLPTAGTESITAQIAATKAQLRAHAERTNDIEQQRAIEDAVDAYVARGVELAARRATADSPEALAAAFDRELRPLRATLDAEIDAYGSRLRRELFATLDDGATWVRRTQIGLLTMTVLAISIGGILGIAIRDGFLAQHRHLTAAYDIAGRALVVRRELFTVVAHDLHRPVQLIASTAAQMMARPARDSDLDLIRIQNAAAQLELALCSVLDIGRIESGEIHLRAEICDVRSVISMACRRVQMIANARQITVRSDAHHAIPVFADRERIVEVLAILLVAVLGQANAGTTVAVAARPFDDGVRFEILDTGSTSTPDALVWALEPSAGGWAGALLARRLIEAHQGAFGVERVAAGTLLWLVLPFRGPHT